MTTNFPAPSPDYVPAKHHGGPGNKPIKRIVLHSTVSPDNPEEGGARAVAKYFQTTDRYASAHYTLDEAMRYQCVWDSNIAYHAPPNRHSLGLEMCDYPRWDHGKRWRNDTYRRMFANTARLTAELCLAYDVPLWWRWPWMLRRGWRGITTHHNVTRAWGQTDHTDPRHFPRWKFMRRVRREASRIRKDKGQLDWNRGPRP